jgi:hypothetical protein
MHLITINYSSDAERKRVEYIFNKYESEDGDIDRITGVSRIIQDDDVEKLLSELYLRAPPEKIKVYKLTEITTKTASESNKIESRLSGQKESIESFIGYLLAQRKAVFKRKMGNLKLYTSTTRKGYAEIIVGISQKDGEVLVQIEIQAEEPNRSYLKDYFSEQLKVFNKSLMK